VPNLGSRFREGPVRANGHQRRGKERSPKFVSASRQPFALSLSLQFRVAFQLGGQAARRDRDDLPAAQVHHRLLRPELLAG
jgi:hypothetical protein